MKFFKINGKIYHLLLISGGRAYLGKPLDVDNEVEWEGVIWQNQPFYFDNEINPYIKTFYYVIRYFKRDCLKRSQFLTDLGL